MSYSSKEARNRKSADTRTPGTGRSALGILILLLVIMVGGVGLTHILVRNKTHAINRQRTTVEREIVEIKERMRSLEIMTEEALTRKNLTDRLIQNRTMLKSILPENIVRVEVEPEIESESSIDAESQPKVVGKP